MALHGAAGVTTAPLRVIGGVNQFLRSAARDVGSADVNDYLREAAGEEFTAKDFRTWAGTVLAACELAGCPECSSTAQRKRAVVAVCKAVAARLGNTVAVCRKCYIHPAVLDAYLAGRFSAAWRCRSRKRPAGASGHGPEEAAVAALLTRLGRAAAPAVRAAARR